MIGGLVVLVVIGVIALVVAFRIERQLVAVTRKAAMLLDMLEERRRVLKPPLSDTPER